MKKIRLTQGQFALVDDEDFKRLNKFKWSANATNSKVTFYASRWNINKNVSMHREIMNPPNNMVIDHINHDTLDNRKCNLRICTYGQNLYNKKIYKQNTSGIPGVRWNKQRREWRAQISFNNKFIHLCWCDNIFEASCHRKSAENKYFGEFAYNKKLTQLTPED